MAFDMMRLTEIGDWLINSETGATLAPEGASDIARQTKDVAITLGK